MTTNRKLIHNLEEAAQRIVDYVMKPENENPLIDLIARVALQVKQNAWSPIYHMFGWQVEVKPSPLDELVANREQKNSRQVLVGIVKFLDSREWDPRLQADLMYEIIKQLPEYKSSDPNPRESLTLPELTELHLILATKAQNIINPVKGEFTQKGSVAKEVSNLPKRDIHEVGKHLPTKSLFAQKPKEWLPANKTIKSERKDILAALEGIYGSRVNAPVTKSGKTSQSVKITETVVPVVIADAYTPVDFIHPYMETGLVAPPPPSTAPVPCAAALTVAEKVVKSDMQPYSANPKKLVITEGMMKMAATLFGPKPAVEIISGNCDNDIISGLEAKRFI